MASNGPFLRIIEISSDSEEDVLRQPHTSAFGSTCKGGNKRHRSHSENDVVELTDNDSSNLSDFPDMLSPLIKGSQREEFGAPKQRLLSTEQYMSLYVDTSDDGESDKDCILVLNDPPSSRKPIRSVPPAKDLFVGVGQVAKDSSLPDSPKEDVVLGSRVAGRSPSKRGMHTVLKAKEQARREKYATELFAKLNKDVFGDCLPKDTILEWSRRLLTTAGRARWYRSCEGVRITKIELASKILDCDERIRNTLSHEMCHLACWIIDNQPREGHGRLFKSWANRVMRKYPDIQISTRHNYEISYPYRWKCDKCSKTYGRYSKSIRPDECACGACRVGKLVPLFAERKPMNPKVSRITEARPRESPSSVVGSPTRNGSPVMQWNCPTSTNVVDVVISDIVDALGGMSINGMRN